MHGDWQRGLGNDMGTGTYTLAQLAEAVGMSPRNVRAYQARGLIDPPRRRGRSAVYDDEHRRRLERVRDAVTQGVSLKRLAALVAEGRVETLEEVVRRLRAADGTTIDLTTSVPTPRAALPTALGEHLAAVAAPAVAALERLGVLSRGPDGLAAPGELGEPLGELFAHHAPVLAHALATAAATAEHDLDLDAAGERPADQVIDLVTRVQWAAVTTARSHAASRTGTA